jgi:hypothetical protein
MGRMRISTRGLMAALVVIGLGLAAIRSGSYTSLKVVYTATILMLLVAVIAARYRPAAEGAFWFGFAVFGWGYLLFAFVPMPLWNVAFSAGNSHRMAEGNPLVVTYEAIEWLAESQARRVHPLQHVAPSVPAGGTSMAPSMAPAAMVTKANLIGTVHLIFAWVFGALGGLIASAFSGHRSPSTEGRSAQSRSQ